MSSSEDRELGALLSLWLFSAWGSGVCGAGDGDLDSGLMAGGGLRSREESSLLSREAMSLLSSM